MLGTAKELWLVDTAACELRLDVLDGTLLEAKETPWIVLDGANTAVD
jgi:hypothetical protein